MADVPASLRDRRDELRHHGPAPGRAWCHAWSDAIDAAIEELARASAHRDRITAVAIGGYGRRELCPGSDVDLLVLHDGLETPALEVVVRDLIYPLWDAGLEVGYALRSRREALAAVSDLDAATALLDARLVTGSAALAASSRDEALRRLHRRPSRFLEALVAADQRRRDRAGDAAEVLEPDLKNGAGGLRDVHSLRWAAAGLVGEVGLDPLVSAGYLGAPDRARLQHAYDLLLAERVALHLETEHPTDTLRLELHERVGARLGHHPAHPDDPAAGHQLLTGHFLAARTVDHIHRRAWVLVSADARAGRRRRRAAETVVDGFELVDGVLRIPSATPVDGESLPTRLLLTLARTGAVLDRRSATRLRRHLADRSEPYGWDGDARRRFLTTLWYGRPALPAVAELDDVGALPALIPEWGPLRGRPQHNPFHRFSLDRHAWHTAAALAELVAEEPWAASTLDDVEDRDALMLGALLHDIGKAVGEPHTETGVPIARAVAERLGLPAAGQNRVATLVAEHLTLPDAATRRDLSDPDVIRAVADRVGDHATLASLHLLAAADGRSTGPSAWTPWKATLVEELVHKARAVLDDRHPHDVGGPEPTAAEAERIAAELGADAGSVRRHLSLLPDRYAAAVSARAIVRHTNLVCDPPGPGEVRTRVTPGGQAGEEPLHDELDVVALDSPGLFARVAGVIALHGGSVLQAHAFTRSDGLAVDTFVVVPPAHASGGSWWVAVEGDLAEAVAGRLAVRARVSQRTAREGRRLARLPNLPTRVTAVDDPSGRTTVVEIHTRDRLGVLYVIASALAELELDIVVAKILTMGHEVVDVFYLRDAAGRPLDADHLHELELAVVSAVAALDG